ncbi:MAG: hypothetical protein IJA24_07050 [Alistipes sp.]|nr:hypothetical protein [Alistipes sp.]
MRKIKDSTIKKFLSRSVQGEIAPQDIPQHFVESWKRIKQYEHFFDNNPTGIKSIDAKNRSICDSMHKVLNNELRAYKIKSETKISFDTKDLFDFICSQMVKLDNGEISIQQAQTQANLAKQANNAMVCALRKAEMFLKHNN